MMPSKLIASLTTTAAAALGLAFAGDEMTSLSYISYLERYATVQPVDGKQTDAVVNMPVVTGDRLDTARGARVEIQLADGGTLWIDEFTTLDFDALAASRENPALRTVLFLQDGTAAIEIPATAVGDENVRFDYPNGSLFLSKPGLYRFDLRSRALHVQAYAGLAELPAGIGSALLRAGQETWLDGSDGIETVAIAAQVDDFWSWVQERRSPSAAARTAETLGTTTSGRTAALDSYGTWVYVDTYSSWAWRPYVQAGWTPYRHGRWYWTSVGWNWISYEPWGWYPYHYGSWFWDTSAGWLWCWDMVWGPAWVHWIYTPGYIGWCPRGYYDYWYYGRDHNYGGGHGGGYDRARPGRWNEVAYDFSGRVRLREVDPRPWNMVPSNQFTNERLDRVRVEPGRILGEAGESSRAYVRSGPLLTAPSRGDVERDFNAGFRGRPGAAGDDDLGTIFRRDDQPARIIPAGASVRAVRTADLVSSGLRRGDATGGARAGTVTNTNDRITPPSGGPLVDYSGGRRPSRGGSGGGTAATGSGSAPGTGTAPSSGDRTGAGTRGGSPGTAPTGRGPVREPATSPRSSTPPASGGSSSAPRPRAVQPAPSGGSRAPATTSPAPSKDAPAPAPRQPGYAARIRSFDQQTAAAARQPAASGGSATATGRTYVVPFAGGRRVVRVTAPSSAGAGTAAQPRGSASTASGSRAAGYAPRAAAPSSGPSTTRSAAPSRVGGSSPRSYQPAPSGGSSPRAVSAPSGPSSPRSSAPSSGGSSRASGVSSSGGSRPSGRR